MAFCGIIIGSVIFMNAHDEAPHELSKILFVVVAAIAFLYSLLAGIRSTADCLSEEKRDGTLGLLFLTDLKGYDVVGGKLVATSLNAFYGLMAIVPLLAIPLLMGGITKGEFWRTALVLVNTFLFSLATGMFISSISKYPRKAIAATFLTLLFFAVGLPLIHSWVAWVYNSPQIDFVCQILQPTYSAFLTADLLYVPAKREFWWSVGVIHGLCWLFLGLASFIVPRSWQDRDAGAKRGRWRQWWHDLNYGDAAERPAYRRRLLNTNAFFWLAARVRLKPAHVWFGIAIAAGLWTWGAVEQGKSWIWEPEVYTLTALVLNTMLKLWIASEATRRFGEDRKSGAMELLLSTPLSVPEILRGQWLALRRQFMVPLFFVLAIECMFVLVGLRYNAMDAETLPVYFASWLGCMIMLVADLLALSAVGMWVGLTAKNPNRATSITIARVLILPLAAGFVIFTGVTLISYNFSSNFEPGWKFTLVLWFGLGIIADAFFGITAWRNLRTQFREVAVQRYSAVPAFWRRLFSSRPRAGAG